MAPAPAQRPPGVVFTPAHLAARAESTLAGHAPQGAHLLDPACGEGALLAAGARSGHWGHLTGLELRPDLAARAADALPGARVRVEDALRPDLAWPRDTWILANPPWVSFSGRQRPAGIARPAPAPNLGASEGRSEGGWPSLHGAFTVRIAEHVGREGTGAVLLLPASLIELPSYAPLREQVEAWARPAAVRELGETAFPGVVEPAVELLLLPRSSSTGSGAEPAAGPQDAWTRSATRDALEAAFRDAPRLPPRTFADPGIHSGNSAAHIIRPLDEAASPEGTPQPTVAQGRDLHPFHLGPASARLRTDLAPTPERRFRIAPRGRYESFPILLRQTADRPIAALHRPAGYFRNSLLACRGIEGLDPAFLVAVLNAPCARAWHRGRFADARQRAFPQVKVGHLATQPMPILHRDQSPELHDEIAGRVRALDPEGEAFARECAAIERRVEAAFDLAPSALDRVRELAATGSSAQRTRK